MLSRYQTILTLVFVLISLRLTAFDDNPKALAPDGDMASADQLFRAGKFAEAETCYQAILQKGAKLIPAQVGLVRSMLKQQKIDESLDVVNKALAVTPDSAALLAVKGDVHFRRGEMSAAETSYLSANTIDPKEVRIHLGLAKLYSSYSLYRKAYDQLETAHTLAPSDIEVQRAWLPMLPRKERLAALEAYLAGPHPDDPEETQWMRDSLDFLRATVDKPVHACKLVSKVEQTETKLEAIVTDGRNMNGIGLSVNLNDHHAHLVLDTGAGGIMVSRKLAEKAGLTQISAGHYGGFGDKGLQNGNRAVADHIRIGELEFQDCVVSVSEKRSVLDQDGLIGADVFSAYLVDIDLPSMKLKLFPLPKRPEDTIAAESLNSEGEDQANAEGAKEESATEEGSKQPKPSAPEPKPARHLPKDRYIAPEMANWTKVLRFGHWMLVSTFVNDSPALLFGLDTGLFGNVLSIRERRQLGNVISDDRLRVRGLSGEVNKISSAKATMRFAQLPQQSMDVVTFDLSPTSRRLGTEISGFLGFTMLRVLEVKLDYRDGLVDFVYDPKRVSAFTR